MKLVRDTPLVVAWRTWLARPPRPSLTVVVKATFDVAPGELSLSERQPFPRGERYVDDDVERPLASPDELAPFKRRGECFVLGACHPPDAPTTRSQIAFQIGAVHKHVAVFGDRIDKRGVGAPSEFVSMPLTWERAFGGPSNAANPAGVELPNLEDPQRTIQARGEQPPPTCTTPIARTWRERASRAGTYDAKWLATRYPGLPEDVDWEYFNEAPADQRIEGYWRGDEEIVLVNLVLGQPSLRMRLPGLRPRAFLTPADAPDPLAHLWEVALQLDTIIVDGEAKHVSCLWRGVLDVASDALTEMGSLCVLHDGPGPPRSLDACLDAFRAVIAREAAREAAAREAATPPEPAGDEPLFKTLVGAELKWAHLDQAMTVQASHESQRELLGQLARMLEARGVTLDPTSPLADLFASAAADGALDERELHAIEDRVLAEERERMSGKARELRERVLRALLAGESCAGWDLSHADLSRLRLSGGDFRGARFTRASLAGTIFGDTCFDGALFEEAELGDAQLEGASFVGAELHVCRLAGAHFGNAVLDDAIFTECLLREARFSHSFARRAEIVRCLASRATVDDSVFDAAELTESDLEGALFSRTSLVDARMMGVRARRARFERCDLAKLRAIDGAELDGSTFAACCGPRARFAGSSARGCDFSFSELDRASFAGARLDGAKLMGCRLRGARFDRASLTEAKLIRADLFEARFEGADLLGADLRGASLFGAELLRARLDAAALELADLTGTRVAR